MEEVFLSDIPEKVDIWDFLKKFIQQDVFAVTFLYESDFSNTPKLRVIMESLFDMYNLDPKDKNRLVLVSDELNNNAVEHGTGETGRNKAMILIKKQWSGIYINIEVTDSWNGSARVMEDLKMQKNAIWFEKYQGIRGRWLFLITEKIADKLYFKDAKWGWLVVWIEKTL